MSYHTIFLIIDSDGPHYSNYTRCRTVWRRYMNLYPDIKCFFIRSNSAQENNIELNEATNTLSFKRSESFIPGIIDNTLDAFKYCTDNYEVKFIVRTNLSSVWNLNVYRNYIDSINSDDFVSAIIGNCNGQNFPSGSGFIMPTKTIKTMLLKKDRIIKDDVLDDVAFGRYFTSNNITMIKGHRTDYTSPVQNYNNVYVKDAYHYRVLYDRGNQDNIISNKIIDDIIS
jgi:hypothetical protein